MYNTSMKKRSDNSLFNSAKQAIVIGILMIIAVIIPVMLLFLNADKLGVFWLVLFFIYCAILSSLIYVVYRYREIVEIRGYFKEEEYKEKYPKDIKIIEFVKKIERFFIN